MTSTIDRDQPAPPEVPPATSGELPTATSAGQSAEQSGGAGHSVEQGEAVPPGDAFDMCASALAMALDSITDERVWPLPDAAVSQRLAQMLQVKHRVDEVIVRLVDAADRRRLAYDSGSPSTATWLAVTHRVPRAEARVLTRQAGQLTNRTEATREAWAAGHVNAEQAFVIAQAINTLSPDVPASSVQQAQSHLIGHARTLTHDELRYLANHVIEVIDPDEADSHLAKQLAAEEQRALQQAQLAIRRTGDGTSRLTGRLPDLQADILKSALEAIAAPRRQAATRVGVPTGDGVSAAFDVDGDHSTAEVGTLTYGQRLGLAFCELLEHLPTDQLPQHGVANATVAITVSHEQLLSGLGEATVDSGTRISAGQARRLACNAGLLPVVLDGRSRILDLGVSKRLYDRYQRIAFAIRDQGCIWSGCDRPPSWCEAHHNRPWSQGGPTDLSNGCLLCWFHHRLIHDTQAGWAIHMAADGIPEVLPPDRIDPDRTPMRHARFLTQPRPG